DGTHIAGLLNSNKVRETRRLPIIAISFGKIL
ncbi:hypothetical protein CO678_41380, partial [Bradyrhizobium diazoefficiens]